MAYQEDTFIDVANAVKEGDFYIIGFVYFAYNSDELDKKDGDELCKLRALYHSTLKYRSVQFYCCGTTDYRGTKDYNIDLGWRRAKSVMVFLNKLFHQYPLYAMAYIPTSLGKEHAQKPKDGIKPSKKAMAKDRSVIVAVNRIPGRIIVLPPIILKPEPVKYVKRIVRRYFSKVESDNLFPPKTPLDSLIDWWQEELGKKLRGENYDFLGYKIIGTEDMLRREYRSTVDYYQINYIYVDFYTLIDYAVKSHITEITYEWGFPNEIISIKITRKRIKGDPLTYYHTIPRNEQERIQGILP